MSDYNEVQFDEPTFDIYESRAERRGLTSLVQNYSGGLVKNRKQAEFVLGFLISICIVVTLFIFLKDDEKYSAGEFPIIPADLRY